MLTLTIPFPPSLTTRLRAVGSAVERRVELAAVLELAAEQVQKEHILTHYVPRVNRLGGVSTGFWRQVYEGIEPGGHDATGATVRMKGPRGLALRVHGGTVRPGKNVSEVTGRPTKALTIPVTAAAHGVPAARYPGQLVRKGGMLVDKATGQPIYRLARKAVHKPDPGIVAPAAEFAKGAEEAFATYLENVEG